MISDSELIEHKTSPIEQIRIFVTRIWNHPLVDENTREHRKLAVTKLDDLLQEFGIDQSTYFTVPVGSLIWAVDEKSDFDYQLVFITRQDQNHADMLFRENSERARAALARERINIVANYPCSVSGFLEDSSYYSNFLFTPDEYIGGNKILAIKTRLKAVKNMIDKRYTKYDWENVVESRFDIFFRKWDDLTLHLTRLYKTEKSDPQRNRSKRISDRLALRAQQSNDPEKYKTVFEKARKELNFPDFQTYSQAIIESSGALSLSTKYSATGITK